MLYFTVLLQLPCLPRDVCVFSCQMLINENVRAFQFASLFQQCDLVLPIDESHNDGRRSVAPPGQWVTCFYVLQVHLYPLALEEGRHLLLHRAGLLVAGLPDVPGHRARVPLMTTSFVRVYCSSSSTRRSRSMIRLSFWAFWRRSCFASSRSPRSSSCCALTAATSRHCAPREVFMSSTSSVVGPFLGGILSLVCVTRENICLNQPFQSRGPFFFYLTGELAAAGS